MNRVLVTGGAGLIRSAVVRPPLRDPHRGGGGSHPPPPPPWGGGGRGGAPGGPRPLHQTRAAIAGCTHVIHLAAIVGGIANFHKLPHTLTEVNNALYNAVFRAALDHGVERFTYVSSSMVFERAEEFPTPEDYIDRCPFPL